MCTQAFGRLVAGAWCALLGALLSAAAAVAAEPAPPSKEGGRDLTELSLEELAAEPVVVAAPPPVTVSAASTASTAPSAAPVGLKQVVSTVSRQESTLGRSPAAVFVITSEMIRRSGATTIPEVLRMAPGLEVARINSNSWGVTSRGFNQLFANKMLVQVDGRIVYNPIFSGVFWDPVDLLLEDVERIEVIRGSGATVWGANAVNGIINIITKSAKDTQGGLLTGGAGSALDRGSSGVRYGGKIGDDLYYRAWGKWFDHGKGFNADGQARDDWRQGRGGFRFDWEPGDRDTATLQGDVFGDESGNFEIHPTPIPQGLPPFTSSSFSLPVVEDRRFTGEDVLGRWTHRLGEKSDWQLQAYYDNLTLQSTNVNVLAINTFDLDYQQQFPLTRRQQLIYGLGYRLQNYVLRGSFSGGFQTAAVPPGFQIQAFPPSRDLNLFSAFVQDQFTLVEDRLYFTAGSKFEHNDFSGFEYQPTARLLWTPSDRQTAWAAISRAVRTPSVLEDGDRITVRPTTLVSGIPVFPRTLPNPAFQSEELLAYELGYRAQTTEAFSWDLALFFNHYSRLDVVAPAGTRTLVPGPPPFFFNPASNQNRMAGETYGVELAANYAPTSKWRLYGAYTFLDMELHADRSLPAATRAGAEAAEGQSPRNQVYLQSSWDLPARTEFDLIGRYVDILPGFRSAVPAYIEMDARLGWKPCRGLEIAVVGQNLLQDHHVELGGNPIVGGRPVIEIPRGVYGTVSLRW